jgi:hypothetical protein
MRIQLKDVLLAVATLLASSGVLHAQIADKPGGAKTQMSAPGADLSGVWRRSRRPPDNSRKYTIFELAMSISSKEPPMTPWAAAKFKANKPNVGPRGVALADSNDPDLSCFPSGVPRVYLERGEPMEILQVPGKVVMLFEYDHFVRQIPTDGRQHAKDLSPSWMGDSVGKWEGNTLVVDTIGFNDKTWLDYDGHPHSEDLHLVERIQRPNHNTMTIDLTIDDPKAYTKPWGGHMIFELKPNWSLGEMICEDNINFSDMQKKSEPGK